MSSSSSSSSPSSPSSCSSPSPSSFEKRKLVQQFPARVFKPTWAGKNCHYQTIVGSGALRKHLLGETETETERQRETVFTADGDFFVVEYSRNFFAARDVSIVVHGLESSGRSRLVVRMADQLMRRGFGCCFFNFRGCAGEDNNTPAGYHVGFTSDLLQIIDLIHERHPEKRLFLTGFSLGGNVCLKLLGELGECAVTKNICGAAVFCVPFDPAGCQRKIDVGLNRILYSKNFLSTLKQKAEKQIIKFPGAFDIEKVRSCETIGDYDDHVVAVVYGFRDKFDYYRQCGSKWFLSRICVPTIAINALDDPFIDHTSLPNPDDVANAPVRLIYHEYGGHCGFESADQTSESGWIAEEIARCVKHLAK